MTDELIDTDRLLDLMRTYRVNGEIDKNVFLQLNEAFGKHFDSRHELIHSRLHVIAHVINTYIHKAYDTIEDECATNWIRKFYNQYMNQKRL